MNLSKEQIKKIGLCAVFACIALYGYFSVLLGPLSLREDNAKKAMVKLEPQLKDAKTQLNRTRAIEEGDVNAPAARELLEVMNRSIPAGASVAWFPQRLSEFFKRQGIEKATYRLTTETPDPNLAGFKASTWSLDLPEVGFASLAVAIAGLENQEGLAQIKTIQIEAEPVNAEFQRARLILTTLVK